MAGQRSNPLDDVLNGLVQAMVQVDDHLKTVSENVRPFDSKELTPQEDVLLFHNPALRYMGQTEPTTGMPYTNAQATQRLLQELGPQQYVEYVEDTVRRMDQRAQSLPDEEVTPNDDASLAG